MEGVEWHVRYGGEVGYTENVLTMRGTLEMFSSDESEGEGGKGQVWGTCLVCAKIG